MKKIFAYGILALALILTLVGCGNNGKNDEAVESPLVSPDNSMYVSPSIDDGIVEDDNGILGDEDNAVNDNGDFMGNGTADGSKNGSTSGTNSGANSANGTTGDGAVTGSGTAGGANGST